MLRLFHSWVSLTARNKKEPFLHRIVTNKNESCSIIKNDLHNGWNTTEVENVQRNKLSLRKSYGDSLLSVNYSCLKSGETIKAEKHFAGTQQMQEKISEPQPELLNRHGVLLIHDNARPHSSKLILKKIKFLLYVILPAYSPDLALTDFHLFKHLQHSSRDKINSVVRWMLKCIRWISCLK